MLIITVIRVAMRAFRAGSADAAALPAASMRCGTDAASRRGRCGHAYRAATAAPAGRRARRLALPGARRCRSHGAPGTRLHRRRLAVGAIAHAHASVDAVRQLEAIAQLQAYVQPVDYFADASSTPTAPTQPPCRSLLEELQPIIACHMQQLHASDALRAEVFELSRRYDQLVARLSEQFVAWDRHLRELERTVAAAAAAAASGSVRPPMVP